MADQLAPEDELRAHLALSLVPGLGPKLTRALIQHFGSAAAVLKQTAAQLKEVPLIGSGKAEAFSQAFQSVDVDAEIRLLEKFGVTPVIHDDPRYPPTLAELEDAPDLIFLRGAPAASDQQAVAIVGSRTCTSYGKRITERIAAGLARAGWTIISGLARGIDGVAHRAALEAGGRTIAVLGGGLAKIYPPEHNDLADQIARQGYLITETPMQVAPQPGMFPARNRIISVLARGVVVVEAHAQSGALITARHAIDQGRALFAVPGPVDSDANAGCLELLRGEARLVRSAEDVLDDLRGPSPTLFDTKPTATMPAGLDDTEQRLWAALDEPKHIDQLARQTGLPIADLTRILMALELKRVVKRLPGNLYDRR